MQTEPFFSFPLSQNAVKRPFNAGIEGDFVINNLFIYNGKISGRQRFFKISRASITGGRMVKAIDYMNYYFSASIKERYDKARTGEMVCRIETSRGAGGFPALTAEQMIAQMDEAGVEKVFLVAWTMFSYWSKKVLVETQIEEIAEVTRKYPDRFVGLAGYNPYHIMDSLRLIEKGVLEVGFKGT